MSFQSRKVIQTKLPISAGITILNPEQIILDFGNESSVDVGALCFLIRDLKTRRNRKDRGKMVDPSSYDSNRAAVVRKAIHQISDEVENRTRRISTIARAAQVGFVQFMDWADEFGYAHACQDVDSAKKAFAAYNNHLRDRVARGEISNNTGATMIGELNSFLSSMFNIDDLHRGVNLVRRKQSETVHTEPPSEANQAKALALCDAIFNGLADLILENRPLPYQLKLPKYLGWENDTLWVFQNRQWFMTPVEIEGRQGLGKPMWGYNYKKGRVSLFEEIVGFVNEEAANKAIRDAESSIQQANEDPQNFSRRSLAAKAHYAFVVMFFANTGINLTQLQDLTWGKEYSLGVERHGFRSIKWRAGGRVQKIEIQSTFLATFKRYLKLREYLLNGHAVEYLFLTIPNDRVSAPKRMSQIGVTNFYRTLQKIDPKLPNISPRQWRAANADWMLRNRVPSSIAASVLQNSEGTVLSSYSAGSSQNHVEEMSVFLQRVSTVVVEQNMVQAEIQGPVGSCIGYGSPIPGEDNPSFKPDCKNPEGCFFCVHHKVHADERDVRKLISCRYCIMKTSPLASSMEHFEAAFGEILLRIQVLLDEINNRTKNTSMVDEVRHSVEVMGELDDYWGSKLELLLNLDLVSE